MCLMPCAFSENTDQPVHLHSLIRVDAGGSLDIYMLSDVLKQALYSYAFHFSMKNNVKVGVRQLKKIICGHQNITFCLLTL